MQYFLLAFSWILWSISISLTVLLECNLMLQCILLQYRILFVGFSDRLFNDVICFHEDEIQGGQKFISFRYCLIEEPCESFGTPCILYRRFCCICSSLYDSLNGFCTCSHICFMQARLMLYTTSLIYEDLLNKPSKLQGFCSLISWSCDH